MELINYSLTIQKKVLLKDVTIKFNSGIVNHILGSNGVGKSCFAKSLLGLLNYKGTVFTPSAPIVIGSYTNIPMDLTTHHLLGYLKKKYGQKQVEKFIKLLNLEESIDYSLCLKDLSDGQKQKIKLMSFLIDEPNVIILDEFTSALDKKAL